MTFKLSTRSLDKMKGVNATLVEVVKEAITLTRVDFGVTCGMRTVAEQEALVAKGASKTMKSKHLEGRAVDLVAYVGPNVTWSLNMYDVDRKLIEDTMIFNTIEHCNYYAKEVTKRYSTHGITSEDRVVAYCVPKKLGIKE